MTVETTFGRWLQRRRKALDLTQEELAQRVSCAAETLRKIEADVRRPSRQIAERLAEALEIPEADRAAFIKAARAELAVDRLAHPTQDLPQIAFVPPPSSNKPITNLPAPLTTFIGREKEQAEVIRLITTHRLVTLTGPGGVGKTRLSIKVGEKVIGDYDHGAWFVELASILDPLLVPRTTASAMGLRDEPQRPIADMLSDYLREKQMLIILDNCEHLLDACAQLADTLLRRCPDLKILATSREVLGILGEAVYPVPSLELADFQQLLENFRRYASVRLFEERAQLARMDFSLKMENAAFVAQICSRLDGIPLAIELAAARIRTFSAEQIATRLQRNFSLLVTGNRTALPRHQTLQAAIDWSYDLLSPEEQTLFRRLSVFVNGWTLEAAQSICSDVNIQSETILELLAQLLNKSLVVAERKQGQDARYQMLETIRQYAVQKAEQNNDLGLKHCSYFAQYVGARFPAIMTYRQQEVIGELVPELANVRLAWTYALEHERYQELRSMAQVLAYLTEFSHRLSEGSLLYMQAIQTWDTHPSQDPLAQSTFGLCLAYHGYFEWRLGHYENAMKRLTESSEILRRLNDPSLYFPMIWIAAILVFSGQLHQAWQYLDESEQLLLEEKPEKGMWMVEWVRGIALLNQGDFVQAKSHLLSSVAWCRKTGDPRASSLAMSFLSRAHMACGEFAEAESVGLESLALSRLQNDTFSIGLELRYLGAIAFAAGNAQKAIILVQEALSAFESIGDTTTYLGTLSDLGDMQLSIKQLDEAHDTYARLVNFSNETGNLQYLLDGVVGLAEIMLQTGEREKAIDWLRFVHQNESANSDTKARTEKALQNLQLGKIKTVALSLDDILRDLK